ncbi:hypothetical protein ABVT39_006363 [Epinephelus coioides]
MAAALTLLLIGSVLQGALCGEIKAIMPQTIEVVSGSCVTIPCSFDVTDQYVSNLDNTCKALWKKDGVIVFDSSQPQTTQSNGQLTGDLTKKDCTTTLNNIQPVDNNKKYSFRLECRGLGYDFYEQISFSVTADPPRPTLTPSTLEVKEGTPVSLTCSAPAPCLSHPPTLTWTRGLGDSQETLQENQDKTKVQTSVVNFTASHLHHGKTISCTATYNKQDGSTESAVSTSLTADISCALCGVFRVIMPQTIEVVSGSCVTIPCSFDVEHKYKLKLDNTCKALWKKDGVIVFDSSQPQTTRNNGQLTGDLTKKDCTTTLNNIQPVDNNKKYSFRLECRDLSYDFPNATSISVTADPPRPTLTPSRLKVKEGTPVSLRCSAPAPCLSHPPNLTWTPGLGDSQETLQENQDKTKVQTSVVSFTASHLHHGKTISCTATYNKQDGSTESAVSTSLTADISYSPKHTAVSVHPSGPVPEGRNVTLTCSSSANPPVKTYTWYRADGDQETFIKAGAVLNIKVSKDDNLFSCEAQNDLGAGRSNISQIDVQFSPQILPSSHCTIAEAQLRCSCRTVGNPSPTLQWYLDGSPVNHSFAISNLSDTGLTSNLTVDQPQEKNLSTLLCRSSNSLGSASRHFCVNSIEPQTSAQSQVLLLAVAGVSLCVNVFFTVCIALLWRARQHVKPKEEDRTYMSINHRDISPEYDVIAQTTPK